MVLPTPQLIQMREKHSKADAISVIIDEKSIDSTTGFMIWDDDNRMLHFIQACDDIYAEENAPFRLRSYDYDYIENILGLYSIGLVEEV